MLQALQKMTAMMIDEQELQQIIHNDIPLTQSMGLRVKKITTDSVSLVAPLENNRNHQNTAFGGSITSMLILASWSLLYLHLKPLGLLGHIVNKESSIKFLQPVSGEIEAYCQIDSHERLDQFIDSFRKKGLARIQLTAQVRGDKGVAVEFSVTYIAQSKKTEKLFEQLICSGTETE